MYKMVYYNHTIPMIPRVYEEGIYRLDGEVVVCLMFISIDKSVCSVYTKWVYKSTLSANISIISLMFCNLFSYIYLYNIYIYICIYSSILSPIISCLPACPTAITQTRAHCTPTAGHSYP